MLTETKGSLSGQNLIPLRDLYFSPGTVPELVGATSVTSTSEKYWKFILWFAGTDEKHFPCETYGFTWDEAARAKESVSKLFKSMNSGRTAEKLDFSTPYALRSWRCEEITQLSEAIEVTIPVDYIFAKEFSSQFVSLSVVNHILQCGRFKQVHKLTPQEICEISTGPADDTTAKNLFSQEGTFYWMGCVYRMTS